MLSSPSPPANPPEANRLDLTVGSPEALQKRGHALWRLIQNNRIHVANINAELQGTGRNTQCLRVALQLAFDLLALAPRVKAPTLFLWAREGNFPRSVYETLVASMPLAIVEDVDAGHLVPMERPDLVIAAVGRFSA